MTSQIIPLDPSQIEPATEILAAAFQHDPLMQYFLPPERQDKLLYEVWHSILRFALPNQAVYTTPELQGVAVWLPPGAFPLNFLRFLLSGFYKVLFQLGFKQLGKLGLFVRIEQYHHQDMNRPHWYLMGLGVSPECQGQGIGGKLIEPILQQADEAGLPCYLETDTPGAVRFYKRRGFEVLRVEEEPVPLWTMKREPQTKK